MVAGIVLWSTGNVPDETPPARIEQRASTTTADTARWMSAQLAPGTSIACDQNVRAELANAGEVLQVSWVGTEELRRAQVVVVTPNTSDRVGPDLAEYTGPTPLAAFGSGAGRIEVRQVISAGSARRRLAGDLADRRAAGGELAGSGRLGLTGAARAKLDSGQVDPRLLSVLATLSADHQMTVADFEDGGPAPVPFRSARITAVAGLQPRQSDPEVRAILRFLQMQVAPYRPMAVQTVQAPRVIRIRYAAPSPVGLMEST